MGLPTDRYDQLEVIGSGGMATVWRAHDSLLDRVVAMKRPHPAPPESVVNARFERESRIAATVSHPNLMTVFDVGIDATGPFLIMEFIDAPSLAATMVPADDVAMIGSQIAAGVAALHAAGIVHRDIKPANVLMAPAGPKLTDFGIARSLDGDDHLTQTGVVHATPAYAAPEVLGRGEHSRAADVYSLGALLLELVTGEPATGHQGTRSMATDPSWVQILGPAMSADPADRPTADELASQLTALSAGRGTPGLASTARLSVVDPTDQRRPGSVRDRSSRAVWAFVVIALLAIGLVALAARRSPGDVAELLPASTASETTLPETTPPELVPDQTIVAELSIAVVRQQFVDFVLALPASEIKNKDGRELVKKVDEAIAAASTGDMNKVMDKLLDAAQGIDEHIESGSNRDGAFALLVAVSELLGADPEALSDLQT